ncbi:MAG: class I SAM-dependent methyltransferase [Spirochaetes bacterium]|nr:class I SAM-dependent methyltransferase [Spirochaetota bacterium]
MTNEHVCPLHMAGLLDNWVRRLIHNPKKIFHDLIKKGQSVLDLGCGPGTFTIDLAKMTGEKGKVFAVDLQKGMLDLVEKKADKFKIKDRIIVHQCGKDELGLTEPVDFALAFYMLHESGAPESLLKDIFNILKPEGKFFLVEPKMHIKKEVYLEAVENAKKIGFHVESNRKITASWAVVLKKVI